MWTPKRAPRGRSSSNLFLGGTSPEVLRNSLTVRGHLNPRAGGHGLFPLPCDRSTDAANVPAHFFDRLSLA